MGKAIFGMILAACAAAAQAQAQAQAGAGADVSLRSGESVWVRIAADGTAAVESRAPAQPMTSFERQALAQLDGIEVAEGSGVQPPVTITGGKAPSIAPGRLRITLRDIAGKSPHNALLEIENGYGQGLHYAAVMHRGERSTPTDVCLVPPGRPGFEHWPYRIDAIDLREFRLVPWKDGDPLPCA